jgi:hypothetical protein
MNAVIRAQVTLAVVGLAAGVLGTARASGSFANPDGRDIGYGALELHLMSYNRLGGVLTVVLSAVALIGTLRRAPALVVLSAAGFAAFAVQILIGFSRISGGNVTGANGATLSFCLMMTIGLAALVWAQRVVDRQASVVG